MTFHPKTAVIAATAFVMGLLTQTSVNVVGNMPLAEFVVLALMAVLTVKLAINRQLPPGMFRSTAFWVAIVAQLVAFAAYVTSDLYRGSTTNDMLRGWSRMFFLGLDVIALAWLFGTSASCFIWTQIGFMLGGVLAVAIEGAQYDAYWKFGLGGPATIALFLISPHFGRLIGIGLIGALGVLHLALDFRSMGGICLLAAMLLAVQSFPRQFRALILIPSLIAGTAFTFWLNARHRSDDADRGNRSTVERTAMYVAASEAFFESPLIGQGSWFSNSRVIDNFMLIRSEGAKLAKVHGYSVDNEETNIAIHSQLLVSVAEGGIFGGTFFVVFGAGIGWALWNCTVRKDMDARTPLYVFTLLNATWNLLFSPFSGPHRIGIAIASGLIFLLWQEAYGATPSPENEEPEPSDDDAPEHFAANRLHAPPQHPQLPILKS